MDQDIPAEYLIPTKHTATHGIYQIKAEFWKTPGGKAELDRTFSNIQQKMREKRIKQLSDEFRGMGASEETIREFAAEMWRRHAAWDALPEEEKNRRAGI